jgi:hypothetical protein
MAAGWKTEELLATVTSKQQPDDQTKDAINVI